MLLVRNIIGYLIYISYVTALCHCYFIVNLRSACELNVEEYDCLMAGVQLDSSFVIF